MGLFRKKPVPPLTDARTVSLLQRATVDMDYGAVQQLYSIYSGVAAADQLWDWWLNQTEDLAVAGDHRLAATAIDFATKANVNPWGDLSSANYQRMHEIRAMIAGNF